MAQMQQHMARAGKVQRYVALLHCQQVKMGGKLALQLCGAAIGKPHARKLGHLLQIAGQKTAEGQQPALGQHPGAAGKKGRDIRKFVTYYLPTAVKILTTYADLSASGAGGENAKSLMSDVEKNAGTIASAFEAQLDALFAGEVLDVSSDIAVLDGMLSGDGLSGKNNLKLS